MPAFLDRNDLTSIAHAGAVPDDAPMQPGGRCPVSGDMSGSALTVIEVKAFVPARDFDLSRRFYRDFGFELAWSTEDLAYFHHGPAAFLLQNFYNKEHAGNFMMHLLVEDVDAWSDHVQARGLAASYGVHVEPPADRSWGMRDFIVVDPTGVLWRIGQNIADRPSAAGNG